MIDVVNLQRKVKLDTSKFRSYIQTISTTLSEANGKAFSVAFVSDRRMTELNNFFRGKDSTTDVLSFPYESDSVNAITPEGATHTFLGDIVISTEQAQEQAEENGLTLENEIKQLILHGVLHLCGYDHERDNGEMNARELELRQQLKI